jgi:hypothetical protein
MYIHTFIGTPIGPTEVVIAYIQAQLHISAYIYIYMYIHVYIYVCMYIHTFIGTPIGPTEGSNSLHSSPATSDGYELIHNPDGYSENTKDRFVELKRYIFINMYS